LTASGGGQIAAPDGFINPITTTSSQTFYAANFRVGGGGGGGGGPTPDTTAPTVAITSPTSGTLVAQRAIVTIAAAASDDRGVSAVTFSVNGAVACTDTSAPYQCAWKVPGGKVRQFTLEAVARDAAGNLGRSALVTVFR
jgi:hypothetical protein